MISRAANWSKIDYTGELPPCMARVAVADMCRNVSKCGVPSGQFFLQKRKLVNFVIHQVRVCTLKFLFFDGIQLLIVFQRDP